MLDDGFKLKCSVDVKKAEGKEKIERYWCDEINVKKILAAINATYAVAKRKPKNRTCQDSNPDLCDTGAAL